MNTNKRTIEVFTAGCPVCRETLAAVREAVSNCGCEVIEQRCEGETCCASAMNYGIKALPTVVVNGRVAFEGRQTPELLSQLIAV